MTTVKPQARRLYRSQTNKVIAGVCGGIGEYFNVDPIVIRIVMIVLGVSGFGLLLYPLAWMVMPTRSPAEAALAAQEELPTSGRDAAFWSAYFPGILLIVLGLMFLAERIWRWIDFDDLWPVLLVVVGLLIIFSGRINRREPNDTNFGPPPAQGPPQ